MPKLPRIKGRDLIRAMERDGFEVVCIKGSHHILQKVFPDGERVTIPIPVHAGHIIKIGTLSGILRKAHISRVETAVSHNRCQHGGIRGTRQVPVTCQVTGTLFAFTLTAAAGQRRR